ncbi:MAG TPA: MFS transporter [Anaerolineales bacterium]|nr:MFS transporter [Anaerolineales bacterium]
MRGAFVQKLLVLSIVADYDELRQNEVMTNYLALIRQRPHFRYLWLAQVISLSGDWFNTIASVILVNRYTNSGLAVGGLFLARALPPFLFGPLAGVAADRFNRKYVLITADLLRAVIVLGFLWVDRPERVWLLYVLSIAQFIVSSFFEPARAAILPSLVAGDELIAANTLSSITWSAMLTLGATMGGLVAAIFGARIALVVDSLSFAASAALVFWIAQPPRRAQHSVRTNGWTDFVAGLGYVRQNPRVGLVALVKAMGQIGSVDIMAAVYAERVFRVGQDGAMTLGLMFAFFGVGAVIGPLIGNALGVRTARALQLAIVVGFMFLPLGWLMLGLAPSLPLALAGVTLRGMGGSINWTYSDVLLQMTTPNNFLGRVFALDFGIFTLALSASVWFTGAAMDRFALDPHAVAVAFAVGSLAPLAVWVVTTRTVRMGER